MDPNMFWWQFVPVLGVYTKSPLKINLTWNNPDLIRTSQTFHHFHKKIKIMEGNKCKTGVFIFFNNLIFSINCFLLLCYNFESNIFYFQNIFETSCKYQCLLLVVYWKEKLKWETEVVTFFTIFRSDVFAGSVFWWNISHFWYWGHFICRPGPRGQDWSHGLHFSQVRHNLLHINLQQFSPWMKQEIASNFILQKRE